MANMRLRNFWNGEEDNYCKLDYKLYQNGYERIH